MLRSFKNLPKPGEPDLKWCAYVAADGHVKLETFTSGHATEQAAREKSAALAGRPELAKQ